MVEKKKKRERKRERDRERNSNLMTSSKPNYLPKASCPNTVPLEWESRFVNPLRD
jgi:hypothetical protein